MLGQAFDHRSATAGPAGGHTIARPRGAVCVARSGRPEQPSAAGPGRAPQRRGRRRRAVRVGPPGAQPCLERGGLIEGRGGLRTGGTTSDMKGRPPTRRDGFPAGRTARMPGVGRPHYRELWLARRTRSNNRGSRPVRIYAEPQAASVPAAAADSDSEAAVSAASGRSLSSPK
jgi:hypothetical protein